MLIPHGFDESNEERKKRLFLERMKKAKHLRERLRHFIMEVESNPSLKASQKKQIIEELTLNQ